MNPVLNNKDLNNPSNPTNDVNPRVMNTHNTFDNSYSHFLTARFGDITPFFVFDTEAKDKVPFSSFHDMRTMTLSSVLMSDINMYKDYFAVPYKAILPNTWDLIYMNPTQGDDVPDDANCVVVNFLNYYNNVLSRFRDNSLNEDVVDYHCLTSSLRMLFFTESIFDNGSLFSLLGCKLNKYMPNYRKLVDSCYVFLQRVFHDLAEYGDFPRILTSADTRYLDVDSGSYLENEKVGFRRIIEFLRDNPDFNLSNFSGVLTDSGFNNSQIFTYFTDYGEIAYYNIPINFSRLVAYQLSCVHFMTNDKVDFIYSADLYRNMMQTYYRNGVSANLPFFDYNGSAIVYDVFSGKYISNILTKMTDAIDISLMLEYGDTTRFQDVFAYWMSLVSFKKSLKYGDYFTGARPRPLAVGDVTAPVVENGVSAIDMTKNIMAQRFLNAVNKTGRKISDYLKGIRGVETMPVLTDPKYLARDVVNIGAQEVENTSDTNQGNIVSILRSQQSKYAFEADITDMVILIGVISFDVVRLYSRTIDRHYFIKDRFDMFNPYFQNIGDQEVYAAEKQVGGLTPISYQLRHNEYKQRYSIASGGFVDDLPTYSFISDNEDGEDRRYEHLSPEFIRSHNTEFDRYYASLNGVTLSDYFHFAFKFHNHCVTNRNMEYSPTIL